jgi:biotin carboxylase
MKDYVIIIGGGELTMPAYISAREELDLSVIAMDYDPSTPGMRYADEAVEVSTKDAAGAAEAATVLAERLPIRGVFTVGADVEVTVAAVAEALGLPGVSLEVARRCNDKILTHRHLDLVGFADKPRYAIVHTAEEARAAAAKIGFPCVVKPIDNCASRGVQRVDSPELLDEAFALASGFNLDKSTGVLIEECLLGTKHTVEMIAYQGEWHLLSIIDTHYISPRWPCETGLNITMLPPEEQRRLFEFAAGAAKAVGIDFGAHKVDVNRDAGGDIRMIELTARLSGGFHCQYASPLAHGSHDIRAALKLAIGLPLDLEDIRHTHERGAAVRAVFPEPGTIVSVDGVEEALAHPGVQKVFVWKKIGDKVGPYHNSADRCAFVIADGETVEEAVANAERGVSAVRIATA